MSIADHMDRRFSRDHSPDHDYPKETLRVDAAIARNNAASHYVLNQSELDYMAETRGWTIVDATSSDAPMASYNRDGVRLNFWLTTGTVGSYLEHPRQGKSQLFRRKITMKEASSIFNDPRQHTGKGYHEKRETKKRRREETSEPGRTCAACSRTKPFADFSKNQRRKGSSARCKTCVG